MKKHFVPNLRWKGQPVKEFKPGQISGDEITTGELVFPGRTVNVVRGVPEFVAPERDRGAEQVKDAFSKYWKTHLLDDANRGKTEMHKEGFRKLFIADLPDVKSADEKITAYLNSKSKILDGGCGPGWSARYFRSNDRQEWYCIDFGEASYLAHQNLCAHPLNFVARASVFELPFPEKFFDLIFSNGVLHHTPDPRGGFASLVRHLAPGGDIHIGVIRKQTPIRDFVDAFIRKYTTTLSIDENLKFGDGIAKFGKELQRHNIKINVPPGLEYVGLDPGEYTLHRLIHTRFMKCFYSAAHSDLENQMQSLDWYGVQYAWPSTEDEIIKWFNEEGLEKLEVWKPRSLGESHEMIRIKGSLPR